jgi:hypothetical protein
MIAMPRTLWHNSNTLNTNKKGQTAMKKIAGVFVVSMLVGSFAVLAQNAPQGQRGNQAPPQPMSFFIANGSGVGGNLGGLAGADKICQSLATAAGSTKTFHAYLSTQGPGAVNARDRIGQGPWYNARGQRVAQNLSDLHGDTLEQARIGNSLTKATALSEKGEPIKGVGDMPNQHDIMTGSQPDGRAFTDAMDHTCSNWTSNGMGSAQLGHHDRTGGGNTSWNSSHASRGCSQMDLVATGGNGNIYCFAIN